MPSFEVAYSTVAELEQWVSRRHEVLEMWLEPLPRTLRRKRIFDASEIFFGTSLPKSCDFEFPPGGKWLMCCSKKGVAFLLDTDATSLSPFVLFGSLPLSCSTEEDENIFESDFKYSYWIDTSKPCLSFLFVVTSLCKRKFHPDLAR